MMEECIFDVMRKKMNLWIQESYLTTTTHNCRDLLDQIMIWWLQYIRHQPPSGQAIPRCWSIFDFRADFEYTIDDDSLRFGIHLSLCTRCVWSCYYIKHPNEIGNIFGACVDIHILPKSNWFVIHPSVHSEC